MATATCTGTLYVQPTAADGNFPVGASTVPYTLSPTPKPIGACTGVEKRNVASPNAPVAFSGVGATDTVTQGSLLYLRSSTPVQVTLTFANPAGPNTTATIPVDGLVIMELDPSRYLLGISVQGTGVVEYLVGGPQ